jgi:hypothetical protein
VLAFAGAVIGVAVLRVRALPLRAPAPGVVLADPIETGGE